MAMLPCQTILCSALQQQKIMYMSSTHIYIYIHIDKLLPAQLLARIIMVPYGRGMEGVRTMWIYVRSTLYLFMFLSQALAKVVLSEELVLIYIYIKIDRKCDIQHCWQQHNIVPCGRKMEGVYYDQSGFMYFRYSLYILLCQFIHVYYHALFIITDTIY